MFQNEEKGTAILPIYIHMAWLGKKPEKTNGRPRAQSHINKARGPTTPHSFYFSLITDRIKPEE
jgi:hypothetical protein